MAKTLSDHAVERLGMLTRQMRESHSACTNERHLLHEREWVLRDGTSLLGESEIWSANIAGIVLDWEKRRQIRDEDTSHKVLKDNEFTQWPTIARWIATEDARDFPLFTAYLNSIQQLQAYAIGLLSERSRNEQQ